MNSDREPPNDDELETLRSELAALRDLVGRLADVRLEMAMLREEVSDLRASAERWRMLYEAAIQRLTERERD